MPSVIELCRYSMGKQLRNLTFDQWVAYVFNHPVEQHRKAWYWDVDRDWWKEDPKDTIRFLTEAFENARQIFQPYSDAQLNQGLWFIVDGSCSNHMHALLDENVPWQKTRRCIDSIHDLFAQCFLRRCTPHLSHLDEPGASPLNLVCYMWWDIMPFYGRPDLPARKEMDEAILRVMESTLYLDSIPCRESGLHGLGHWQHYYPERVGAIIDRFSMSQPDLPEKLKQYMIRAYSGVVL